MPKIALRLCVTIRASARTLVTHSPNLVPRMAAQAALWLWLGVPGRIRTCNTRFEGFAKHRLWPPPGISRYMRACSNASDVACDRRSFPNYSQRVVSPVYSGRPSRNGLLETTAPSWPAGAPPTTSLNLTPAGRPDTSDAPYAFASAHMCFAVIGRSGSVPCLPWRCSTAVRETFRED